MKQVKLTFMQIVSIAFVVGMLAFTIQSCKKEPPKEKEEKTKDDDDNPNDNGKDYIISEGFRAEFRNPAIGSMYYQSGDTALRWAGNQPSGGIGDTILTIMHPTMDMEGNDIVSRVAGKHTIVDKLADYFEVGKVMIVLRLGTLDGRPVVNLTGGDYTLSRNSSGKWVSTLKNGTGTWTKSNGDKVDYTGIEFRAIWPQ